MEHILNATHYVYNAILMENVMYVNLDMFWIHKPANVSFVMVVEAA